MNRVFSPKKVYLLVEETERAAGAVHDKLAELLNGCPPELELVPSGATVASDKEGRLGSIPVPVQT